tara:strand:- start:1312 stop:1653 length:342 start_codon:yes stop_codon:yes gene_type:complete
MEITGLGKSSIYNRIELATFPRQKKLGPRTVAWLESDIDEWLDSIGCLHTTPISAPSKPTPEQIATITTPATPEPDNFRFTISNAGVLTITSQNASLRLTGHETKQLRKFLNR